MIFRPKQKQLLTTSPLKIDNTIIEGVKHITFGDVYIDQHLVWKMHINYICTKISTKIGMLYKARFHVPCKYLLLFYYT